MADFTVRIELIGAPEERYEALSQQMKVAGFFNYASGSDSSGRKGTWALPTGEYTFSSDQLSAQAVRDYAKEIAQEIESEVWVLVSETTKRSWSTKRLRLERR